MDSCPPDPVPCARKHSLLLLPRPPNSSGCEIPIAVNPGLVGCGGDWTCTAEVGREMVDANMVVLCFAWYAYPCPTRSLTLVPPGLRSLPTSPIPDVTHRPR